MEPTIPAESRTTSFRTVTHRVGETAFYAEATFTEYNNLSTGDSVEAVTVNSIVELPSGQTVAPKTLSIDEFKSLITKLKLAPAKGL